MKYWTIFGMHGSMIEMRNKTTVNKFLYSDRTISMKKLNLKRLNLKRQTVKCQISRNRHDNDFRNFDIFHRAINSCIFYSQIFGLMPLSNLLQSNPYKMIFQIRSFAMLGTAFFLIFGTLKYVCVLGNYLEKGLTVRNVVDLLFFTVTIATCLLFLNLTRKWPKLMQYWTQVDMLFLKSPYEMPRRSLKFKLRCVFCCFSVIAVVEHILSYASKYYNYRMKSLLCSANQSDVSFRHFLFLEQYTAEFSVLSFNAFTATGVVFLNFCFTYIWNFMDLFIMLVSIGLSQRFRQFSKRLKKLQGLFLPDSVWYETRQHHIVLCEMLEHVDEHLSPIILVSALNNMYFICYQLLYIFTGLRWTINYLYSWFSLIFLIGRTASSFLCASYIHEASMEPLKVLYMVPTGHWTTEVQRFFSQLTNQCTALSGKGLYHITRRNLFGYFSTIVTYELVLLQLDRRGQETTLPELCD